MLCIYKLYGEDKCYSTTIKIINFNKENGGSCFSKPLCSKEKTKLCLPKPQKKMNNMDYIDTEFDQYLKIAQKLVNRKNGTEGYYVGDYELPFRKSKASSLMSGSLFVLSTLLIYYI